MQFSERLKKLRHEKNLSHYDMADILGMTRQSYAYLERKQDDKKLDYIVTLANYFGVSTDYLLGISDFPNPIDRKDQEFMDQILDDELKDWIANEVNNLNKEDLHKLKTLWELMNK